MQATVALLDITLAAAVTGEVLGAAVAMPNGRVESLGLFASFVRAGGGTTAQAWVQTSLDGGASWMDIANFAFTTTSANRAYNLDDTAVTAIATPTDGSLTDNTCVNGHLGALYRVKVTTVGTYTGASSFKIWATPR